jgi:hypothetical protein
LPSCWIRDNLPAIRFTTGGRTILAEIDVVAVDRDDDLAGTFVEPIPRSALDRTDV